MTVSEEEAKTPAAQLPQMPKATIKKPVRPDFAERDTKVSKLLDKVQEFQKRVKEISKKLDDIHSAGRGNNRLEKCKRELADIRHMKQQLQKRRDIARSKLQEINSVVGTKPAVKKSTQVASADDISSAMATLQATLNSTSDPDQQRRIVEQIQKLHASYESITGEKYTPGSERLRVQLTAEITACTTELEALAPSEEEARTRLEQLQAEQQATEPDIQGLKEEREQCTEIINELRDKVTEIREEWQAKFTAFKEQMDLWKAEQDELRAQRQAYYDAEREAKNTERKARDLEVMGAPFTEEILRCDQLLLWCQKYQTAAEQDAPKANLDAPKVLDGFVMRSKEPEEDMFTFKKAKNKKEKKSGRKSQGSTAADKSKLQLDMDALALFSKLRLPVPSSVAEVNELVQKVEKKKEEYMDKQKRALAGEVVEQEAPEVAEEASSSSKAEKGTVVVDMRSDEVFGTVLLELMVA